MEFPISKKMYHLVVNPGTLRCPTAQEVIKFLTSRSSQFVSLLDVIVSKEGEGDRLESKEEASEESKWREKRVISTFLKTFFSIETVGHFRVVVSLCFKARLIKELCHKI